MRKIEIDNQENDVELSQESINALIENTKEGFTFFDDNGNFLFVNNATANIFGLAKEELLSNNIRNFISKADFEKISDYSNIENNISLKHEITIITTDGVKKNILVNVNPEFENEEYLGAFGIFSDVAKQKNIEPQVTTSNTDIKRIFDNIPDVYFEISFDGIILQISPAIEKLSDYKREDIIGESIYNLYLNPKERDIYLSKLAENGHIENYPIVLKDKNHSPITCIISSRLFKDKETDENRMVGSIRLMQDKFKDVDNIQQIEKEYYKILSKASVNMDIEQIKKLKRDLIKAYGEREKEMVERSEELITANQKLQNEVNERKNTENKLIEKSKSQALLLKFAKYINSSLQVKEVLQRIAREVMELFNSYGSAIYRYDAKDNLLYPQVVIDPDFMDEIAQTPLELDSSFTGKSFLAKKCMVFNDAWDSTGGHQIPGTTEAKDERLLVAPFISNNKAIGAICLNRVGPKFTNDDLEFMEAVANYATSAMINAQNYQKIEEEIRERKLAETALDESENKYSSLLNNVPVGIFRASPIGNFYRVNPMLANMLGYDSENELVNVPIIEIYANPDDRIHLLNKLKKDGQIKDVEIQLKKKDNSIIWVSLNIKQINNGSEKWIFQDGTITDITERKRAQLIQDAIYKISHEALLSTNIDSLFEKIHNELSLVIQTKNFYIALYDKKTKIITASYYHDQFKTTHPEPQILKNGLTAYVINNATSLYLDKKSRIALIENGDIPDIEWKSELWLGVPLMIGNDVIGAMAVQSYDDENAYNRNDLKILEFVSAQIATAINRKSNEYALLKSEQLNRAIISNSPIGITVRDKNGNLLNANKTWMNIWGIDNLSEYFNKEKSEFGFDNKDEYLGDHLDKIKSVYSSGGKYFIPELKITPRRLNEVKWISNYFYAITDSNGDVDKVIILTEDVTKRKKTEYDFIRTQSRLNTIFKYVPNVVFYETGGEEEYISENIENLLGYPFEKFLNDEIKFTDFIDEQDKKVIEVKYIDWLKSDKKEMLTLWYKVWKKDKSFLWIEDRIFEMRTADNKINIGGVRIDITQIKKSKEKLQELLNETVNGLVSAVEMRDPYTAGHQRRVASLAVEIAKEMHLSIDVIDGIYMAALIHDIGKINIPSEILSKPGKLTKNEFELIKAHPETGYDIVKSIEFPWPIANIILQHHERIDGSSYPNGLKKDEICIHAKILCVADVIEAMSSHRPYRAAIGLDAALDEIKSNSGKLYESEVVDACLRVFDKGFKFVEQNRITI